MGGADRDQNDSLARNKSADPVDNGRSENAPTRFCFRNVFCDFALCHTGIVLKRKRCKSVVTTHESGECYYCSNIGAMPIERLAFRADVEITALNANNPHPPVTGGKKAISSPSRIFVSNEACS